MVVPTQIPGYCESGLNLYRDGTAQSLQDEARHATAIVFEMISQNGQAAQEVRTWAANSPGTSKRTAYAFTAAVIDTVTNPWFWIATMHRPPSPLVTSAGGCCNPSGCCSGGGNSSKRVKALFLMATIGVLFAAFLAAGHLAVKHGSDAVNAKRKADEIKNRHKNANDPRVQTIYSKIAPEQNKEVVSQSLKALFTGTGAVGVGCLTISAMIALYAVLNHIPVASSAKTFLIAGGAATGASLAAHVVRGVTLQAQQEREVRILNGLFNEIIKLEAPHPFMLLALTDEENADLPIGNILYTKRGQRFERREITESQPLPPYIPGESPPRYSVRQDPPPEYRA